MAKKVSVNEKFANLLEKRTLASAETPLAGGLVGLTLGAPLSHPPPRYRAVSDTGFVARTFAICLKPWSPADLFLFPINNVALVVKF